MPRCGGQPARRWARCARIWAPSCKQLNTRQSLSTSFDSRAKAADAVTLRLHAPQGLSDPHAKVRWAACQALGQMCTDLGPKLQTAEHARILPALQRTMEDFGEPRVQSHAAAALVNFAEDCEEVCSVHPLIYQLNVPMHVAGLLSWTRHMHVSDLHCHATDFQTA